VAELLAPVDRVLVGHALSNDLTALLLTHPASRTRDTQLYAARKPSARPVKSADKGKQNADIPSAPTLWEKYRTPRVALKRLAKEELRVDIQAGEHSSVSVIFESLKLLALITRIFKVTDARAAMAIYRLHKRAWDASLPMSHVIPPAGTARRAPDEEDSGISGAEDDAQPKRKRRSSDAQVFPGGGRRGVSSGLSTIVRGVTHKGTTSKGGRRGRPLAATKGAQHSQVGKGKWWQSLGEGEGKGQLRLA
jgi:RNA exonuclease 4